MEAYLIFFEELERIVTLVWIDQVGPDVAVFAIWAHEPDTAAVFHADDPVIPLAEFADGVVARDHTRRVIPFS